MIKLSQPMLDHINNHDDIHDTFLETARRGMFRYESNPDGDITHAELTESGLAAVKTIKGDDHDYEYIIGSMFGFGNT